MLKLKRLSMRTLRQNRELFDKLLSGNAGYLDLYDLAIALVEEWDFKDADGNLMQVDPDAELNAEQLKILMDATLTAVNEFTDTVNIPLARA